MPYCVRFLAALTSLLAACGPGASCTTGCASDDAGAADGSLDDASRDAAAVDASGPDTGVCATCIRVTVTNGMSTAPAGVVLDFEGILVPLPAFGVTTPSQAIDIGTDATLTVTSPFLVAGASIGVAAGRSYDWVLAGTPHAIRVLALPDLYTTSTGGIAQVTVVNMTDVDVAAGLSTASAGPVPAQTAGDHISAAFDSLAPLVVTRTDGLLLAGFDWAALGNAHLYAALVGDRDLPLADPASLRLVPVVPGASAQTPLPLFHALNATQAPLVVCDSVGLLASVAAHTLAGPFVGTPDALSPVHVASGVCGATNAHAASSAGTGGWLYAAIGDASGADPSTWSLVEVAADAGLHLVDATSARADYTTSGGAPALVQQPVAAGAWYSGPLASAPTSIQQRLLDAGGTVTSDLTFGWAPRSPVEFGVFVGTGAASYAALEIDMPPGMAAVLTEAIP